MSTLTKNDIIDDIVIQHCIARAEASEGLETVLGIIKETLEKGEPVSISGFGKWSTRDKRERRGRNPKTGESTVIEKRRVVTFSLSKVLREILEGK